MSSPVARVSTFDVIATEDKTLQTALEKAAHVLTYISRVHRQRLHSVSQHVEYDNGLFTVYSTYAYGELSNGTESE